MARPVERQPDSDRMFSVAWDEALSLSEDDVTGLWELRWGVRTEFPEASEARVIDAAREALMELLNRGCVRIVWWHPSDDSEKPIDHVHHSQLLDNPRSWDPPGDLHSPQIRFFASGTSDQACMRREISA